MIPAVIAFLNVTPTGQSPSRTFGSSPLFWAFPGWPTLCSEFLLSAQQTILKTSSTHHLHSFGELLDLTPNMRLQMPSRVEYPLEARNTESLTRPDNVWRCGNTPSTVISCKLTSNRQRGGVYYGQRQCRRMVAAPARCTVGFDLLYVPSRMLAGVRLTESWRFQIRELWRMTSRMALFGRRSAPCFHEEYK